MCATTAGPAARKGTARAPAPPQRQTYTKPAEVGNVERLSPTKTEIALTPTSGALSPSPSKRNWRHDTLIKLRAYLARRAEEGAGADKGEGLDQGECQDYSAAATYLDTVEGDGGWVRPCGSVAEDLRLVEEEIRKCELKEALSLAFAVTWMLAFHGGWR